MADKAHIQTDLRLAQMERHLSEIYSQAHKDVGEAWRAYLTEAESEISELQKAYDLAKQSGDRDEIRKAGRKLSTAKKRRTIMDKRFSEVTQRTAAELSNINATALAYINGQLPEIYSMNYNELQRKVDGFGGYSFSTLNAETVRHLATTDKSLLPYRQIDTAKDIAWNVRKMNAEVLKGILVGEPMGKIAERLASVEQMNENAAIRNARTMVTGAENKGRQDSYAQADEDGIILQKKWVETSDGRTRHTHRHQPEGVGGEIVSQEETFSNGLMFPGDPSGDPSEVYNCRCTMTAKVIGFRKAQVQKATEKALNEDGITQTEMKIFDSIRNKKKENLIVYDDYGNIVHRESGTKNHTGYEDFDYRGLHTVHNHPVGVFYYPSKQDLITFHSSGAKSMAVVSPEHTIKFIRTKDVVDDFYELSSEDAVSNAQVYGLQSPFGRMSPQEYRQKHGLTMKETNAMRAEYELERIKRIMERAGYRVIIL